MTDNTSTRPAVASITQADIDDGKTMAILAYIMFLIPLFAARDKKFAMYHTEQAIALWIAFIAIYIVMFILTIVVNQISDALGCVISIIGILPWVAYVVLWIMGLLNAIGGKVKELPVVGAWGAKFNLVK
ncbi:MAG: zinc ribbon domain-containing protein [Ignavibacteria bacterium]|nr:zinc ribbon domain-containing protein [Ignavibacteria bacterium]